MQKEVKFSEWCQKCKHFTKKENEDPCWDCLTAPANEDSTKPIKWTEKEK